MSHFFTPFLKETAIDLVRFTREVLNGISTWMERQDLWGAVGGGAQLCTKEWALRKA